MTNTTPTLRTLDSAKLREQLDSRSITLADLTRAGLSRSTLHRARNGGVGLTTLRKIQSTISTWPVLLTD